MSPQRPPRIIFLGMEGDFSLPSLRALLKHDIEVSAVVIPAQQVPDYELQPVRQREQPHLTHAVLPLLHASIVQLAWEQGIPVWEVGRMSDPEVISILARYEPDIICVACFSQRIPRAILDLPRLGCLNVHPSLLPANRGPVPLFWTFHEGCQRTGVTIHLMNAVMDGGAILTQEVINVPDGISYAQLEALCAMRGGELLVRTVQDLYKGIVRRIPQDETKSSYHVFPSNGDFVVYPCKWTARHAYNFICGLAHWGEPIQLYVDGKYLPVQEATAYRLEDVDNIPSEPGRGSWVRCKVGWVRVVHSPDART